MMDESPHSQSSGPNPASPARDRARRNAEALSTDHLNASLGRRAARGGAIALIAQLTRLSIQIGGIMILSRLLSPDDYGIFAMAGTITIFLSVFTDLGLSTATIQRPMLTQEIVSTLFAVNIMVGTGLSLLIMAISPLAAAYFKEPVIQPILMVLATSFLIAAAGAQHNALLARQMRFFTLQLMATVAQILALAAAILFALFTNAGPWAFVVQGMVGVVAATLGAWWLCDWRPSFPINLRAARGEIAFGGHVTGNSLLSYFERQTDNILIGRRWGATELGYYSRGYSLLVMPITMINIAVSSAVVPALSRLSHDSVAWNRLFLKASTGTSYIGIGVSVILFVTAEPLVLFILGKEWMPVVQIFQILSISSAIAIAANNCNWAFVSLGRTKEYFYWSLIAAPPQVLSFFIGLPGKGVGVATAYAAAVALIMPFYFYYTSRYAPVTLRQFGSWLTPVFVAAGLSALAGHVVSQAIAGLPLLWRFILAGTATGCVYIAIGAAALIWLGRYREARNDIVELWCHRFPRKIELPS